MKFLVIVTTLIMLKIVYCVGDMKQSLRQLRVINGTATDGYTYVVVILELRGFMRKCSASLITKTWALTAAHCQIQNREHKFRIIYGDITIQAYKTKFYKNILRCINHPRYREKQQIQLRVDTNDISLILTEPIDVEPVILSAVDYTTLIGRPVRYVGIGLTASDKDFHKGTKKTVMDIIRQDNIKKRQYGEAVVTKCDQLESSQSAALLCLRPLCSYGQRVQVGDSGGPVLYKGKVVGVGCSVYPYTGRAQYTAVSPYLDWIHNTISNVKGTE